jgi:cytochrome oxidase Cu insertion factor (SCO1/SenC/PrrC family)
MKRRFSPLVILAAVFAGPLVLAIVLYAGRGSFGGFGSLSNPDRELIENPPTVPAMTLTSREGTSVASFQSRWFLIYARMPACDEACVDALERLGQVYLALGKERERVRLVFLAPEAQLDATPPADFLAGALDAPDGAAWVRLLGPGRLEDGRYFVVDPLGNLILSYPADADQKRLLEDLERLLDVSRIG